MLYSEERHYEGAVKNIKTPSFRRTIKVTGQKHLSTVSNVFVQKQLAD